MDTDKYRKAAADRLKNLEREEPFPGGFLDIILELPNKGSGVWYTAARKVVDEPLIPKELILSIKADRKHYSLGNIPGIPLPNGLFLFYCNCRADNLPYLLSNNEIARAYRAASWYELYESDYEYWDLVFDVVAKRRSIDGNTTRWRGRFAELQPGDEPQGVFVPCVFAGSEPVYLKLNEHVKEKWIPKYIKIGDEYWGGPNGFHYFFVNDFGVDLDGKSHVDLPQDVQWWPSVKFPYDDYLLSERKVLTRDEPEQITDSFTGVIRVSLDETGSSISIKEDVERNRERIRRTLSILDLVFGARMRIVGDAAVLKTNKENIYSLARWGESSYWNLRPFGRRHFLRRSRYEEKVLANAIDNAFREPKSNKDILAAVHKSLDSWGLSRMLRDLPVVHVLTWAAIEALLNLGETEIISNITLCLLGLDDWDMPRNDFWKLAKKSYNVRSKIVHSFTISHDDKEVKDALRFAEVCFAKLIKYYFETGLTKKREEVADDLRKRGLDPRC